MSQATSTTPTVPLKTRTASCNCGKLAFVVEGEPMFTGLCHCRNCRKATSAPVSLICGISDGQFKWVREDAVKIVPLSDKFQGYLCSDCGCLVAQKPIGYQFYGTMACCYDEMRNAFNPLDEVVKKDNFFKPNNHLNFENRVIDFEDSLVKFMDFPQSFGGSGRIYEKKSE